MKLKTIEGIKDLKGKRVLLRLDLNVPIENGMVKDDFRIKKSLKTYEYLKENGAKIIIISHIGSGGEMSLAPIARYLKVPLLELKIDAELNKKIDEMNDGEAIMLENLRKDPREILNENSFSKELASIADIYVNEAFSVSHRKHCSIAGVVEYIPSYYGFLFADEVKNLSMAFKPEHPFIFILGGAKFETKLSLVNKFLDIADKIFICGALANSFYKEAGYETGKSLVDVKNLNLNEIQKNPKIVLPEDVVVETESGERIVKDFTSLQKKERIIDAGPAYLEKIKEAVGSSKFILWNGPIGIFEIGQGETTKEVAKIISESKAKSIIGGGDTLAAIEEMGILDEFTFVSTGGGAMLDFLAYGTLHGIEAMKTNKK